MRANHFAESVAIIGFFIGAVLTGLGSATAGTVIGLGSVVWWVVFGRNMKGWIGPDFEELVKEEKKLSALVAEWKYPDGSQVPMEKRQKIMARQVKVWKQMEQHPCNPSNKYK